MSEQNPDIDQPNGNRLALTTSWDDGHPLDFRIAESLAKYGLSGTFYVPLRNSRPTLSPAQIRELSHSFDVGAHTVNHLRLIALEDDRANLEIVDSKRQLEDITGKPCSVFCFPGGYYRSNHLNMLRAAGFSGARTVELLSFKRPRRVAGLSLIPTTVQAYPHAFSAYLRNTTKRLSLEGLKTVFLQRHRQTWQDLAIMLLKHTAHIGGVFHLWGHSWEIEETRQWEALDQVLAAMSGYKERASVLTNLELCGDI